MGAAAVLRTTNLLFALGVLVLLAGCGNGAGDTAGEPSGDAADETTPAADAPAVTFTPGESAEIASKPTGPVEISYRIIGAPVVGQQVAVDLRIASKIGSEPITVSYRINDETAIKLAEAQPAQVTMLQPADAEFVAQQVLVVPQREGRLFLNVAADVQTEGGTISTVTAVPLQVGAAPTSPTENGTVTTDENGEAIRVLPES